jgi:hypothetical protein
MNRFVSRYSSSPLSLPQEENFSQLCGKWDAAQELAFPSFDIPAIHNVKYTFEQPKQKQLNLHCIYSLLIS